MSEDKIMVNVLREIVIYAFNLIVVLIPVSVLAVDLYVNVQRVRYFSAIKEVKSNVLPWIKPEYLPVSLSPEQQKKMQKDRSRSVLEVVIKDIKSYLGNFIGMIISGKCSNSTFNSKEVKEREVKCSLEALRSMVDKLKAEKEKLESLHNTIVYAFNQRLDKQEPGTVEVIYYDKKEKEEILQLVSENPLHKPEKVKYVHPPRDVMEGEDLYIRVVNLLDKSREIIRWVLSAPVEAKPRSGENFNEATQNNGVTISDLDLDSDSKYLFEGL